MSLRGYCPKQSFACFRRDCFGKTPRNDRWGGLSSVENMFGFILEVL
ncbi:MAG: hypothetical protein JETT_0545 [Candidatus Jettenia ecosi]|uniref:Uncharacterized protein n=1 Tax=Candidatus Jettenia ecosi TaxID=2494326 RepID=A0A533QR68_9BACT|nr:MAG: hypothetical protein JETT_0545 [Candidatus Jettenia ecosi]